MRKPEASILPILLFFFLLLPRGEAGGGEGREDHWNVRMAPSPDASVVASVKRGTPLTILGRAGAWCEIPAPANAEVWGASCFLDADGSLKAGARLRSGPGVIYPEYRYVPSSPGPVRIVEQERAYDGGWRKILPIPGLRCYIHQSFSDGEKRPAAAVSLPPRRISPEKKSRRELHSITVEGMPVRLNRRTENADYELILEINGKKTPICYLVSLHLNLTLWENRMVRIVGRFRWIQGFSRPFLEIEKISPSWK